MDMKNKNDKMSNIFGSEIAKNSSSMVEGQFGCGSLGYMNWT